MAPRLNFLPTALSKALLEFQQEGVLFGISKNGRCLIGDEMGLGKTLQALSIAYYYKSEWPLLIVCPSSMRFPWIEEIEKWLPDIQPGDINLVLSGMDVSKLKNCKISIIGYGLLSHSASRLLINSLKDTKFGVVIVDESHYMKNRKAARTKALVSVIKNAKRAVLLTGTPALARPEELYVQIDVVKPNLLGSFGKFAARFCEARVEFVCGGRVRRWNTQGASNLDELHNILKTNVMIRRLKRDVLTQLPPKRRQKITFDLADSDNKKVSFNWVPYTLVERGEDWDKVAELVFSKSIWEGSNTQVTEVIKEFREVLGLIRGRRSSKTSNALDKNPFIEMHRLATVLYKQTGLSKISAVRQYIADILENSDKKFLVFAHHLDVMKAIELEVVKKKVKYIRIAGDVPSALRGSLVNQFQNDGSVRVAILSLLAASVGITLTAADHIIFTELHWTPGVMEQAEDRVHRIGQENSVLVQYLVAKGTIDEVLWRMVCNKVYVTTATLNGRLQGLDVEEASEGQSKLLEAFSAWVMEDEENEEVEEDEFLFTHSQKKRKQDVFQRSLTEFFHSASTSKCRKTDFGKEWSELPDTSSEEEEKMQLSPVVEPSNTEPEVCVVEEMEEENSVGKISKKTYKIATRKPPTTQNQAARGSRLKVVVSDPGKKKSISEDDFSTALGLRPDCELTHEANKMEDEKEKDMLDTLSSYTRILRKPKLAKDDASKEITDVDENSEATTEDEGDQLNGSPDLSKEVVILDLTEDNSTVSLEGKKGNATVPCGHVEQLKQDVSGVNVSVHSNAKDLDDFKVENSWHCGLCTFNNSGFLLVCEMCDTPRRKSRRNLTKTALSTPKFVKLKQQRILDRCLSPERRSKSRGIISEEKGIAVVTDNRDAKEDLGFNGIVKDISVTVPRCEVESVDVKAELCEEREKVGSEDSTVVPNLPGDEMVSQECSASVDKHEVIPKINGVSEAGNEKNSTRNSVSLEEELHNEEVSDDLMMSSAESTEEAKAAAEELFLSGNEFDDLTDDDWWQCESCHKFNYDELADTCELCFVPRAKLNGQLEDTLPNLQDDWWRCEECGEFYFDSDIKECAKCNMSKAKAKAKKSFAINWVKYSHLIVEDSDDPGGDDGMSGIVENLRFCLSNYTDRVYLYSEDGEPLNCNVGLLDLESSNTENIPNLLVESSNRRQAMRFLRKWKSLPQRDRRLLQKSGMVFEDPYEAVEAVKMGRKQNSCTTRFPSKEKLQAEVMEAALINDGTVRQCTKTKGQRRRGSTGMNNTASTKTSEDFNSATATSNRKTWIQAIDGDGRPLCIFCKSLVDTKNTDCEWDERFCSHKCKEDYQIRISATRVRHRLFEEEQGVCQKCGLDAHGLYRSLKLLPKTERRAFLEDTPFISLPVSSLNKIIIDPKEGMFWEADHVVPVVEGGGECGLDNYRTLCVPCHRQATAELRERLRANRQKALIAGVPDITSFFKS